ncbi:MAG: ketol-acid reductoisomerase, partial [Chloroflexota bacterium]|nr:ketol-acid reductoisomerase [Chloroflexota bacterium]
FAVRSIANCARWADLVALLLPDQVHAAVFAESIAPHLHPGDALLVAHGFSVHFGQIVPPPGVDVILVAPVGPGSMVRRLFEQGSGVPGLIAAAPGAGAGAEDIALSYAAALGCTRVGVLRTSFEEETITDLFGEQAVLCGGIPALINAAYDTLVEAGYQPELAYFECVHQVKLIVDLIYESGIAGMRVAISDTARFGAYDAAPRVVNDGVRSALRALLSDIQRGEFARAWLAEAAAGMGEMRRRQEQEANLPIEDVGRRLRNLT